MLDGLGSKSEPIEPILREFNGLLMRRIAVLDLGSNPAQVPYTVREVDRRVTMFFDAGSVVYELIHPQGFRTSCKRTARASTPRSIRRASQDSVSALLFRQVGAFVRAAARGADCRHLADGGQGVTR